MADFEVFSIDLQALDRVVGSRDQRLVEAIVTPDDPPELRVAMRSIVGTGTRPFVGDAYSLARTTLRICRVVGRRVNANTSDLLNGTSLARVVEITRGLGIDTGVDELVATDVVPIRRKP